MNRRAFEQLLDTFNATPPAEHIALIEAHPLATIDELVDLLEGVETPEEADAIARTNPQLAAEWADACAAYAEMCSWSRKCDAIVAAPEAERESMIAALTPGQRHAFITSMLDERECGDDEQKWAEHYLSLVLT